MVIAVQLSGKHQNAFVPVSSVGLLAVRSQGAD